MDFYYYTTNYQLSKRHMKKLKKKITSDEISWYDETVRDIVRLVKDPRMGNMISTLHAEQMWTGFGRPYYKVFPEMAEAMSEVSIDIPASQLKYPYPAFTILLANSSKNTLREEGGPRIKCLMVSEINVKYVGSGRFTVQKKVKTTSGSDQALHIIYEFDHLWRGKPCQFDYTLSLRDIDGSLEDFFDKSWQSSSEGMRTSIGKDEYSPSHDMCMRIVKLAVATCFFGIDRHEVVMPDLPRRVIEKRSFQNRIPQIEALQQFKREMNKTKHWTIGREISLPQPIVVRKRNDSPERKELTHGYMKRGHMRWQICGAGKKDRKLIFVHPHICRPDLPLATSHGYRISDNNLKRKTS